MNYRHAFHAGNHVDVFKHAALTFVLEWLLQKPAPFAVLDTHAGVGLYDLTTGEAQRTREYEAGVGRVFEPGLASAPGYSALLREINPDGLATYPGSPEIVRRMLRAEDRLIACELHPDDAGALRARYRGDGRAAVHHRDGYEAMGALLPPKERRGLVLIDPPYESLDELKQMLQAFAEAYRRWPSGVYLMWYPIRSASQRSMVHARFEALGIPKMLFADLAIHPDDAGIGLAGSGLMVVNPPYGADDYLAEAYAAIHQRIAAPGAGYVEVARLTPERVAQ